MSFISGPGLKAYARRQDVLSRAQEQLHRAIKSTAEATVFLSHSHQDADYIQEARILFYSLGIILYVDWADPTMPRETNAQTAVELKKKIVACDKFVVLASGNALSSRWVPWELGYADSTSGLNNIAIMPVDDNNAQWKGNEYLGVYYSVQLIPSGQYQRQLAVYRPDGTFVDFLENWLRKRY